MEPIDIFEVKTHLSQYVELTESGQDVIIARDGKPVARLTAIHKKCAIRFGVLKSRIHAAVDFDAPLPDEVLGSFAGSCRRGIPEQPPFVNGWPSIAWTTWP
ncbi:MAG: type II toxin-antitoxin system Phd/YefM family antitoxin [Sulfuritalea sp.]|nr:type II toxin-antitoxin system Phd/YefM family antitoxin [Sulfuritalea sp.]